MIDRSNGCTDPAVLKAMEVSSLLDMEAMSPGRGTQGWYRALQDLAMPDPSPLGSCA